MSKTLTKTCPLYDIHKTYLDNADYGPFFPDQLPERVWPPESEWIDFLDFKIATPLGVPAGPLLNSKWTTLAARLGFDVLTYKTIRSYEHPSHPLPNVMFVDVQGKIDHDRIGDVAIPLDTIPLELAITNSFGNPSRSPEYLQMDIHLAAHALHKGQVLIVSVFGTGDTFEAMSQDFIKAAILAKDSGAEIIEANFSCPNVSSGGALFSDAAASYKLAKEIACAINPTPLIVKMGVFKNPKELEPVILSLARAGVRGISAINTVPMKVINDKGEPALGKNRLQSGICGDPIRPLALSFMKDAKKIITGHKLDLELIGCGGITKPVHFDEFLNAGANVAMSATGMMWDPHLAHKWRNQ